MNRWSFLALNSGSDEAACGLSGRRRPCFIDQRDRRGVLLLLALVMLTLFLMLGTTYMIATSQRRPCGSLLGVVGLESVEAAKEVVSVTTERLLVATPDVGDDSAAASGGTGPSAPERVKSFLRSSIFADKYGSRCQVASLAAAIEQITPPLSTVPGIYKIVASPISHVPQNGESRLDDSTLGPFPGRILGLSTARGDTAAAFRILASFSTGPSNKTFFAHLLNATGPFDASLFPPQSPLSIQGREFTGKSSDTSDWHESYDAPDSRNQFLAWSQVDAVLGRNHVAGDPDAPQQAWRFIVPSFHRPDKLLAAMKEHPDDFPAEWTAYGPGSPPSMLRPRGKMTLSPDARWDQYGFSPEQATNLQQVFDNSQRATATVEHPNFTGTNVRLIDGNKVYFDPINGPWDVDNDGDGIADSVWIDVGMSEVTFDNVRCQPLVAMMVVDLDSRANLNVHDCLADRRFGASPFVENPSTGSGVFFAGTDPDTNPTQPDAAPGYATATTGIGWGPADIRLRHVLNPYGNFEATLSLDPGFASLVSQLSRGTEATGSAFVSGGVSIPNIKSEGRYGDAVDRPGLPAALNPAPGLLSVSDPPIGLTGGLPPDNHLPNRFGARDAASQSVKPLGSPIDPWGVTKVILDQMGQPYFARTGDAAAWAGDTIDDPYDLSVGLNAPKPGWSYDPNVTTSPSTFQDNLFTPTQLERLLRLYEPRTESLSPRVVSLLGNTTDLSRLTMTTESWDTTAACVPLDLLTDLLDLSDQHDSAKPSLISWDLQLGVRMDINRPFGNGLDDNANGIADEPNETGEPTFSELAANNWNSSHLCNGRAPNSDARSLFARHLYCLLRTVCPSVPAKEAAQWAVNVVDYRDSDSIMTRFVYDPDFDPAVGAWAVDAADPDLNPDLVVWGCERPELLMTEAMAWNNVVKTNGVYSNAAQEGGLIVELYHPWTGTTDDGKFANPIPPEFLKQTSDGGEGYLTSAAVDLTKLNPQGEPIFQLVAVEHTTATDDQLRDDVTWPSNAGTVADAAAIFYAGPATAPPQTAANSGYHRAWSPENGPPNDSIYDVGPGQFAVLASAKPGTDFTDPDPNAPNDLTGASTFFSPIGKAGSLAGVLFDLADFADNAIHQPIRMRGAISEQSTDNSDFHPDLRATGRSYPKNARVNVTANGAQEEQVSGPVGAVIPMVANAAGTGMAIPLAQATDANATPEPKQFRLLFRRLANPLAAFNDSTNPYITVDSLVIQQQVCVITSDPVPNTSLKTTERGDGQDPANNIWKQPEPNPPEGFTANSPSTIEWTLGFFSPEVKIPAKGDRETPPFPWLTWLNRDYSNVHELLLVPKSSPVTLLQEHSHEWPFAHLFFGGGAEDNEVDPSERLGIFEFLRTVSRFADSEFVFPVADSVALSQQLVTAGGKPLLLPPHNRLTTFREPGRVNLNTLSSSAIWNALNDGRPPAPYEDEVFYNDDGTEIPFEPSEDWGAVSDTAIAPPSTGNWVLDTSLSEDANGNGKLDFHHDTDNNGFQARSREGLLRSLASSRRGWGIPDTTAPIAGQFDRVLNRAGVQPDQMWFANPFRSGWVTASPGNYKPDASLLLRRRRTVDAFVRLNKPASGTGYGRLDQQIPDLVGGREYTISIKFRDNFQPAAGDHMPQFRQGSNYFNSTSTGSGAGFSTATFTPPASGDYMLTLSLFSKTFVDVDSVVMFDTVSGKQLVKNTNFQEVTGTTPTSWGTEGGSIEAMGLNPTDANDPALRLQPDLLFSPNLYLRGKPQTPGDTAPILRGYAYKSPERNPYFAYQNLFGLSNITTPRSNVFAVWITVGFFEVEPHPDVAGQMALGAEYGLDTGKAARHKAFMLIDRSIPVGFRAGRTLTEQVAILLDKFEP